MNECPPGLGGFTVKHWEEKGKREAVLLGRRLMEGCAPLAREPFVEAALQRLSMPSRRGLFFCWPKKRGEKKGLGREFGRLARMGKNLIQSGRLPFRSVGRCASHIICSPANSVRVPIIEPPPPIGQLLTPSFVKGGCRSSGGKGMKKAGGGGVRFGAGLCSALTR